MTVTDPTPGAAGNKLRRLPDYCGEYIRRRDLARGLLPGGDDPVRFGRPSGYSLTALELARHVRTLRKTGWQSWEIRARFTRAA